MNQLMFLVIVLALFVYFGGSMVPSVLKQNKEMLLGGAVGLVLCSFMGLRLEGWDRLPLNRKPKVPWKPSDRPWRPAWPEPWRRRRP
jgi:hypothetical protein